MFEQLPPRDADLAELVALFAHDLKNPLAALMTNLHFLRTTVEGLDEDAAEALADSAVLCEVLERYIKNLDVVAAPPDPLGGAPGSVDLVRVAESLATRHRAQAKTTGVELAVEAAPDTPAAAVDGELLVRAADNLLSNAIENAPPGSTVRVQIGPDPSLGEGKLAFTVVDTGTVHDPERAISAETAPRIARRRVLGARYGRGLALLAADSAAEAAGARLELASVTGDRRRRLVVAAAPDAVEVDARTRSRQ